MYITHIGALLAHLRRMNVLSDESPLGDINKKMDSYVKRRYVDKVKLEHMDDSGEKVEMELRWGARARIEMPEENVVQFMKEVIHMNDVIGNIQITDRYFVLTTLCSFVPLREYQVFGREAPMGLEASIMKAAGIKANNASETQEEAEQQS